MNKNYHFSFQVVRLSFVTSIFTLQIICIDGLSLHRSTHTVKIAIADVTSCSFISLVHLIEAKKALPYYENFHYFYHRVVF